MQILIKRIRKQLRGLKPQVLEVEGSKQNIELLRKICKEIHEEYKIVEGKEYLAMSAEEEATKALIAIQNKEKIDSRKNFLSSLTEEEIKKLCKKYKVEYAEAKIHPLIKNLVKQHPETAYGLINSLQWLKKS